jgi:transcription elongation factor GreB
VPTPDTIDDIETTAQAMSRAFVRENDDAPDDEPAEADVSAIPAGAKNYITPAGHSRLRAEFDELWKSERPALVKTIAWAASNGDRSENADYIYGKRRLREIDRRLRFLSKRLEQAEVVDPLQQDKSEQVFFGATVSMRSAAGVEQTLSIVGIDEGDPARGRVSWISPVARALLRARTGDVVLLKTPAGTETLEILAIRYEPLD